MRLGGIFANAFACNWSPIEPPNPVSGARK